jgi:dTDP-glucose pyrophosphorylase
MTRRLHILMPMGGLGARFASQGFGLPKPLIPVDGMPMFRKALSSFDGLSPAPAVTTIIRRELDETFALGSRIRQAASGATVVVIERLTRGAVETCLAASDVIRNDDAVMVLDCDLWFESTEYLALIGDVLAGRRALAGALLTFMGNDPRYSFARLAGKRVVETAEKHAISAHAIAGAYFFSSGEIFLRAARELVSHSVEHEYYVSLLYNIIIRQGGEVEAVHASDYRSFGTPGELIAYEGSSDTSSVQP